MKITPLIILASTVALSACSSSQSKDTTIATLSKKTLNLEEPKAVHLKRENTAGFYRKFLEAAPVGNMYGDAMRRLADIELQTGQDKAASDNKKDRFKSKKKIKVAIRLYETFLETYPNRKNNDLIYYQLAKAYELDLKQQKLLLTLNTIVEKFPKTQYIEEVQFRRGETYFVLGKYKLAEHAYASIVNNHPDSSYYEKSLYKYGWTRFKQSDYAAASKSFLNFLDRKYAQGQLSIDGPSSSISRSDKELLGDVLRVTSLSFSYQQGHLSVNEYFSTNGQKPYESIIYNNLAELYLEKDRIRDASVTYLAFSKRYPTSSLAPKYHSKAIDAYKKGGFASLVLPAKISFVKQYGINTKYWKVQSIKARESITPLLKQHIKELANHFHAQARKFKKADKANNKNYRAKNTRFSTSIAQATIWYRTYITSFPKETGTEKLNFLLAEAHQDAGQYRNAIYQFEKTAYQYPQHKKQQTAAYAALLLYPSIEISLKNKTNGNKQRSIAL